MIVVMNLDAGESAIKAVEEKLEEHGYSCHLIRGVARLVVAAVGSELGGVPPGLERLGLEYLAQAGKETGLAAALGKQFVKGKVLNED